MVGGIRMSNNIIFSSLPAEKLNEKLLEISSGRPFIFCNYNPESIPVINDDARFLIAITNLYKLLIDAGICNQLKKVKKNYHMTFDYNQLEDIAAIVNGLRTVLGHNVDARNGDDCVNQVVDKWFIETIGKKRPDSIDDFKICNDKLERYGEGCVDILESFLNEVKVNDKKDSIINEIIQLNLQFYNRPSSKNIIRAQILQAYEAKKGMAVSNSDVSIADWTKRMFLYKEQSQIDNFKNVIQILKNIDNKTLNELHAKIANYEDELRAKNQKVADFKKKTIENLRIFDYLDYYVNSMPKRIEEYLKQNPNISLLPQDIIQDIIEVDFKDVRV